MNSGGRFAEYWGEGGGGVSICMSKGFRGPFKGYNYQFWLFKIFYQYKTAQNRLYKMCIMHCGIIGYIVQNYILLDIANFSFI
jgi:hypothetical protein